MSKKRDGWGRPLGNYSAAMIVDAILEDCSDRHTIKWAFQGIDDETMAEIKDTWATLIQSVRHPEDLKRPTYAELSARAAKDNRETGGRDA